MNIRRNAGLSASFIVVPSPRRNDSLAAGRWGN